MTKQVSLSFSIKCAGVKGKRRSVLYVQQRVFTCDNCYVHVCYRHVCSSTSGVSYEQHVSRTPGWRSARFNSKRLDGSRKRDLSSGSSILYVMWSHLRKIPLLWHWMVNNWQLNSLTRLVSSILGPKDTLYRDHLQFNQHIWRHDCKELPVLSHGYISKCFINHNESVDTLMEKW
jgi:hypothetical protein